MSRKNVSGIMLTLLLIGMLTLAFNIQQVKSEPTTVIVPDDYPTIQGAINSASPGDTIYVRAGTYNENVVVNKSVSLVGENRATTIIDVEGRYATSPYYGAVQVIANNVKISGFTIRNSPQPGIALQHNDFPPYYVGHDIVIQNNLISNNSEGVYVCDYTNVVITDNLVTYNIVSGVNLIVCNDTIVNNNTITNNLVYGIYIWSDCWNNTIGNNTITDNKWGIRYDSSGNIISNNIIAGNTHAGIEMQARKNYEQNNTISHNSFFNKKQVVVSFGSVNIWDNGYPIGGNYWSDHAEVDNFSGPYQNETGSDGIEDRPYVIDANNTDRYPQMTPSLLSEHDLAASICASELLITGTLTSIEVSAYNLGLNNENNVSLELLINDVIVISEVITTFESGSVYTFNYSWTPSVEGNYNLTALTQPVPEESTTINNAKLVIVTVHTPQTELSRLCISPSESHTIPGGTMTVDVMVEDVEDLWSWGISLYYNTTLLTCTDAWYPEGHVFDGKPFMPLTPCIRDDFNATHGEVLFACSLMGPGTARFYGSGILCTIQLEALTLGTSFLNFSLPYGASTFLLNYDLGDIPAEVVNGFIIVEELKGDLNGDGVVDIRDIAIAALAFGSFPDHPRWNPIADTNEDNKVDIRDIALIAIHYGEVYT